jgi:hypothetical protein
MVYSHRSDNQGDTYIRIAVTMLYAHWEGFVRAAAKAYIEFVAMQRLRLCELPSHFIALAIRNIFNSADTTNRTEAHIHVVEFLLSRMSERSVLPWKTAINTKSNLNSEVLRQITATLGLDYADYVTKEKLIDEKLLRTRNEVAHGQYLLIGYQQYVSLHDEVLGLIQLFFNQVDNAASMAAYRIPRGAT